MQNKKLDKLDNLILNPNKGVLSIVGIVLGHLAGLALLFVITSILCPNKVSLHDIPLQDAVPGIFRNMNIIPAFTMKDHFAFFLAILMLIAFVAVYEAPLLIMNLKEKPDSGMSILLLLAVLEAILFVFEYHWVWKVDITTEYIIKGILVGAVLLFGNFLIMYCGHLWLGIVCNLVFAFCAIFVFNYILWGFIIMAFVIWVVKTLMTSDVFWLWMIFRR